MSETQAGRMERWAGPATGIAAAIITMTGLAISDLSDLSGVSPRASGATIARVFAENKDRFRLGTTVLMVGLFFMVWFLVYLQGRLNPAGTTRWMASVTSASGLITVVLMALIVAYVRTLVETSFSETDMAIQKGIVLLDWDYWRTWTPFVSAYTLASGIAIVRASLLPKPVGWGAIALAFTPLVLPPGLMTIVFIFWTLVLATGLLIKDLRND